MESADQQFRKLHALVESLVVHRKGKGKRFPGTSTRISSIHAFSLQRIRKYYISFPFFPSARPELSLNTASFAKSAAMLGSAEDNTALSRALSQLAEVEDKMEQLHQDQASNDTFSFAELIADFTRLLGAVRVRRRTATLHRNNSFLEPEVERCSFLPAGVV